MAPLLQQFSLGHDNWFFRNFGMFPSSANSKIISNLKSDADNYWFIIEDVLDNQTNKVFSLSETDAEIALKDNVTITKISKTPFCVKLNFEELKLSDGETLSLSVKIRVRITNPVRFYCRYKSQFADYDCIPDGDDLHSLWETPFQNVLQVEAHKVDYPSWTTSLAGPVIASAIKVMYFAPMAAKYVDGTELELVESVDGYSPSIEKRSEEEQKTLMAAKAAQEAEKAEIKKRQAELAEKEKTELMHTQNMEALKEQQTILQEKRALLQGQIDLKEKEIEAKNAEIAIMQEKRLLIDQENRIRKEKEEALIKKQLETRNKIIEANSKKWPTLSEDEIIIAHNFSTTIKKRLETNGFKIDNAAVIARSVTFRGAVGHFNTLSHNSSLGFTFNAPKSGYVTILNLGTSGKMTILIPNALTGSDTDQVKTERGVQYYFPQSFMPELDGSFNEDAKSGLEGIYVFITQQPFLNCRKAEKEQFKLDYLPYSQVQKIIEMLDEIPEESWCVGCLEFLVVEQNQE